MEWRSLFVGWNPKWQTSLDIIVKCFRHIRDAAEESNVCRRVSAEGTSRSYAGEAGCAGHWAECLRIVGELDNDHAFLDEAERQTELLRSYLGHNDVFRAYRFTSRLLVSIFGRATRNTARSLLLQMRNAARTFKGRT